jgi:hypothetical protein
MYSSSQFASLEFMCRERAAGSKKKKEMEYWLVEAEEWKQLKELRILRDLEAQRATV